jgi:hypothetical protein
MSGLTPGDFSLVLVGWGRRFPAAQETVALAQRAERSGYYSAGFAWLTTLPLSWGEGEGLVTGWPLIMDGFPGHSLR